MERTFSRRLLDREMDHFKLVADFVVELERLAEADTDKARLEHSYSLLATNRKILSSFC